MSRTRKIPVGWVETTLGEFMKFKNGVNADKGAYGRGTKFVNVMDVFKKSFLKEGDITGSVQITEKQLSEYSVINGDILFNRTSETPEEIAFSAVYTGDETITFGGFVIRGRQTKNFLLPEFARHCFKSNRIRKEMIRRSQGKVRANIGQKDLNKIPILIPTKDEQEKIAHILSTWDTAIEKTERLIAAKEKRFKWLLKKLISDQQDNPKWHKVKLGQVIEDIGDGGTPSRKNTDYFGGGIPWVVIDDITFKIEKTKETLSKLGLSKSSAKIWPKDSVIVSTGATIGHVGIATVPMATKQGITGITPKKSIISEYLAYFFLAQTHLLVKYAQGSSFKEIRPETIKKIAFFHPSINRQEDIVRTLKSAQKEIAVLRLLAEKYRSQQRGLMQKLLMGNGR